jgi:hypothetical protein
MAETCESSATNSGFQVQNSSCDAMHLPRPQEEDTNLFFMLQPSYSFFPNSEGKGREQRRRELERDRKEAIFWV